jgi:type II secretory pathway component PulM
MNQVRDWLANLSVRERNLVYGAAALLGVLLLYLLLVLPFQTADSRLTKRVEQKSANLAWMREKAPQIMSAAGTVQSRQGGESLVVIVDRTAREAGLGTALRDQSPTGENGLRLRLEAASFDTLVAWLVSLQQQHGIGIDAATVDAAAPGLVNATLTLSQASAAG